MKRWAYLLLMIPLILAARGTATNSDLLLRQADAAYRAGDPARAAELYDRAGVRTPEPARATFNLATARYRQAREGRLAALAEAEVNYRACLGHERYRAASLFGLGNCLLLRAETGASLDRAVLLAALDRYAECLADPGCDSDLAASTRYNRARVRLLLLQTPPAEPPGEDPPGDEPDEKKDEPQPKQREDGDPQSGKTDPAPGGSDEGGKETPTDQPKDGADRPGKSLTLTPPPDDEQAAPIARDEAESHLEQAAQRILNELARHRRSKVRPPAAGGKDW